MTEEQADSPFEVKRALSFGALVWVIAFFWAMIIMVTIGVDFQDPDLEFGPDHSLYWTFEAIMIPSFLAISLGLFTLYFRKSTIPAAGWVREGVMVGLTVMVVQFALDLIVLVLLFGNGLEYFSAMVSITYLTIPLIVLAVAWFWKGRDGTIESGVEGE